MERLLEAIRRLLVTIVWLPTVGMVAYAVFNYEPKHANQIDEAVLLIGGFFFGSAAVHYVVNWIFQVNDKRQSFAGHHEETQSFDDQDAPLTVEAYMDKHSTLLYLVGMTWFIGIVWFGNVKSGFPIPYWGMWSSFHAFANYWTATWIYFAAGISGFFIIRVLAERNYRSKLRRMGYL